MKQKRRNRLLAALLAVAMMFQMVPMLAFADDAPDEAETYAAWIGDQGYTTLEAAVTAAQSGDTITLGEGNYTLYGISSNGTTKGKDLTFVGQGTDKTVWNIGYKTEQAGGEDCDYSFDGAGKITFQNMTLQCGTGNYHGFARIDDTVVKDCVINGKTFYWGYTSAVFRNTTFNAPTSGWAGDYAIWTYSSPTMTFDTCTFNASGKAVNVYTDYGAGKYDITVNFNNCTVNSKFSSSASLYKTALNINDSNMGGYKYILNITSPQVTAARDTMTCSQVFGFGGKAANNTGKTDVYLDSELVWQNGKMQTHAYTDGEKNQDYTTTYSGWTKIDERNDVRDVTKTCNYCKWSETKQEIASVYRLQYNLNEGTGAEDADYSDAFYHETETLTVAAAPTREGYQFTGWVDLAGKRYAAGDEITLKGDTVLTAQWKKAEPVIDDDAVNHTLTVVGGTFTAEKDGTALIAETTEESGVLTAKLPEGATVTVTLNKDAVPENMNFDQWTINDEKLMGDPSVTYNKETVTFTMPDHDLKVEAMYKDASIDDGGSDIIGSVVIGATVVAGGAALGYQAYKLGTDLLGDLWGLPYFPSNRSALALMLWEDAGKPMPESDILYPDVGWEEQDMDLQHAARWAMEHDLIPDKNDKNADLSPEEVKFFPNDMVSKYSVLKAWKKAQELKKNA